MERSAGSGVERRLVRLKRLPAADRLENALPAGHTVLVTDDGTPLPLHVARRLAARGQRVIRIALDGDLERARAEGPVGGLVHLHSRFGPGDGRKEKEVLRAVFLLAGKLHADLRRAGGVFLTAARLDGRLGMGGDGYSPAAGALCGLVKTLRHEWDNVLCRAVDLHPELGPEEAADALLAEMEDPDRGLAEVGFDGSRWTAVAELQALGEERRKMEPGRVCLVSGGGRGITALCVEELARRFRWKFLLLGRTAMDVPEPAWAEGDTDLRKQRIEHARKTGERLTPPQIRAEVASVLARRQVRETLRRVAEAGGEAVYLQADLRDTAALRAALASDAARRLGPVTALIHGAGALADRRIENKTALDFETVYGAKVDGLEALLEAVPPERLDLAVLFSSVAGFYGNPGQADYAMANEALNRYAHVLRRRCRTVAVNWGPWDTGMVTPELREAFLRRGVAVIPAQEGARLLADELESGGDEPQVLLGGPLAPEARTAGPSEVRLHRRVRLADNPFLRDHAIAGRPVLPATCAISWMAAAAERLHPGWVFHKCSGFQVLKGVVFDAGEKELTLDLRRVGEGCFEAAIRSQTLHYRASVLLARRLPPAPAFAASPADGPPLPSPYRDGSLFHGPGLQGLAEIRQAGAGLLAMGRLPAPPEGWEGQFPAGIFNPYLLDAQGQTLLVWVRHARGVLCLPSQIASVEVFRPLAFDQDFHVALDIRSQGETTVTADVVAHDGAGSVYSRALGIEAVLVPEAAHRRRSS